MSLDPDDYLGWVCRTTGRQDLILVTRNGMSIRFNEQDVRVMGRPAAGVSAIRLRPDDEVAGMDVVTDPRGDLLVVTEYGFGKRTPLREYGRQRRYGYGVRTLSKNLRKTGRIIGARVVSPDDSLTLITAGGIALRTEVESINVYGRVTSGVKLIDLPDDDVLVSMALVRGEKAQRPAAASGDGALPQDDEPYEPLPDEAYEQAGDEDFDDEPDDMDEADDFTDDEDSGR
jgi:DNA gyrase subunit A